MWLQTSSIPGAPVCLKAGVLQLACKWTKVMASMFSHSVSDSHRYNNDTASKHIVTVSTLVVWHIIRIITLHGILDHRDLGCTCYSPPPNQAVQYKRENGNVVHCLNLRCVGIGRILCTPMFITQHVCLVHNQTASNVWTR